MVSSSSSIYITYHCPEEISKVEDGRDPGVPLALQTEIWNERVRRGIIEGQLVWKAILSAAWLLEPDETQGLTQKLNHVRHIELILHR